MFKLRSINREQKHHDVSLIEASSKYALSIVLDIVNKHGGLVKDKSLYQLKDETYYIIKDSVSGEPVGVTGYRPLNDWCVEQLNTAVLPTHRGLGYGKKASNLLLSKLEAAYGKIFCTVNTKNHVMVGIKIDAGFEIEAVLKNHFADGRNIFVLARKGLKNK